MHICLCNSFNDKKVTDYLKSKKNEPVKLCDVYKACSGGERPQCGTCVRTVLKDMVTEHNNRLRPE